MCLQRVRLPDGRIGRVINIAMQIVPNAAQLKGLVIPDDKAGAAGLQQINFAIWAVVAVEHEPDYAVIALAETEPLWDD